MEYCRQGFKVTLFLIAIGLLCYQLSNAMVTILNPPMMMTKRTVDITDNSVPSPLVYICPLDQYNNAKLIDHGYTDAYEMLEGKIDSNDSIPRTWGGYHQNMSFTELVRAVINIDPDELKDYFETDFFVGASKPVLFPKFGYCLETKFNVSKMNFIQHLKKEQNFSVLLTDIQTKTHYGVNIGSVTGDMISVMQLTSSVYSYSVEVEMYHSKDTLNCNADPDYLYANCVDDYVHSDLKPLFGCVPPFLSATDHCKTYDTKGRDDAIDELMGNYLNYLFVMAPTESERNCLKPCKQQQKISLRSQAPSIFPFSVATIYFEPEVKVVIEEPSYIWFNFIVDVELQLSSGSSLGTWVGLSAISLIDISLNPINYIKSIFNWIKC